MTAPARNLPFRILPTAAVLAVAGVAVALGAGAATSGAGAGTANGRCVGMFVASPGSGGLPRSVAADATNLTVRGTVPCRDAVMAWAPQGPYRVFEDGTVEFLAAPVPPCNGGDFYVWVGFPK